MKNPKKGYKLVKWMFGKTIKIPEEWRIKKLDEIGEIIGGGTPDSTNMEYWEGEILWAVPTDITKLQTNLIESTERRITEKGLDNSSAKLLPIGTVLITSRATLGECAIATKAIATNQGFQNIICNEDQNNLFLFYVMKYNLNTLVRLSYGTTFLEISKKDMRKISVCLPYSDHEQQRIASILSGVDAMIESTQQVVNKAERLKNGLMQKLLTRGIGHTKFKRVPWMFGREIEIPEEWKINQISKVFEYLKTGTNPRNDLREHGGVMYIHYGDIHTKWDMVLDCNYSEIPFINKEKVGYLSLLKDGDLIVVDASEDHEGSGTSVVVKNVSKKMVSGLHTIALRDNNQNTQVDFRAYITSIRFVKTQIIASVTGISVYGLSKKKLGKIKIPIPSLPEQQKIASILSGVDASSYVQLIINARPYIIPTILLILFTATLRHEFYNTEKNIHSYHNS